MAAQEIDVDRAFWPGFEETWNTARKLAGDPTAAAILVLAAATNHVAFRLAGIGDTVSTELPRLRDRT